jgi:hypothetical protein
MNTQCNRMLHYSSVALRYSCVAGLRDLFAYLLQLRQHGFSNCPGCSVSLYSVGTSPHQLSGCRVFTKIDLVRAYNQIPVHPSDIQKTAITSVQVAVDGLPERWYKSSDVLRMGTRLWPVCFSQSCCHTELSFLGISR